MVFITQQDGSFCGVPDLDLLLCCIIFIPNPGVDRVIYILMELFISHIAVVPLPDLHRNHSIMQPILSTDHLYGHIQMFYVMGDDNICNTCNDNICVPLTNFIRGLCLAGHLDLLLFFPFHPLFCG